MKYVGAILAMVLVFVVHITVIGMVVRVHATAVSVTAATATGSDTTPVATFPEIHGMTDLIYFHLSKGMSLYTKVLLWLGVGCGILMICVLLLLARSRPPVET